MLSLIFEEQRDDSLYAKLSRASRAAATVRDRLSSDLLRAVSHLGGWRALRKVPRGATSRPVTRWRC